jgi:hypothetical protein
MRCYGFYTKLFTDSKAPLESVNILPTACKLLSSLNANALASLPEVAVLYVEKTISGNLKGFYLDENQQRITKRQ